MHFLSKISAIGICIFCSFAALAQAPAIQWQNCLGGSGYDQVTSIQQTEDGGYYVAVGSFDFRLVKLMPNGNIEWQKYFGGGAEDIALCIKNVPDHGSIMCGYTKSTDGDVVGNHGGSDMWVVRTDVFGNVIWKKCYGGTGDEQARYISLDPKGGFIVAGLTTSYDGDVKGRKMKTTAPDCDVWVVKLDDSGTIVWQKTFGGAMSDAANCIRPTNDNGYILIGDTYSNDGDVSHFHYSPDTTADAWVIKLDMAGDTLWERAYGGSGNESGTSVMQCPDGSYILGGITGSSDGDVSGNNGDDDGWFVKLDLAGRIQWQKCIGGNNGDGIYEIGTTPDGGYVAAGVEGSNNIPGNHGGYDFFITKLTDKGNIFWQKCLGGTNHDYGACMTQSNDNGFVMGGWTMSNDGDVSGNHGGHFDSWVVKMDPDTAKLPPLNIAGLQQHSIFVYPTYTNGSVEVEDAEDNSYVITDLSGKILQQGNITLSKQELSLNNFAAGSYLLLFKNSASSNICKLVKY